MFIPLTSAERESFLKQNSDSFVPGYTGHCPTLKFQYGKCYGTDTRDIMRRLRDENIIRSSRVEYRADDPGKYVLTPIKRTKDQAKDTTEHISRREAKYILGYTGYIPGLNFEYGKSFIRAANEGLENFYVRRRNHEDQWRPNKPLIPKNPVILNTVRPRDEVTKALDDYIHKTKYREQPISYKSPPIAGYTGHIPRVKGTEESLSKRYNCVAQLGLELLQRDREKRNQMSEVHGQIKQILTEADKKYLPS